MKRKTKDGKVIIKEMARWNPLIKKDEVCVHYQVLPDQRRFLYRVLNQLQPIPIDEMDSNERNLFQKIAQIIGSGEYTSDDIPMLDVARLWFSEYIKSPRTIMTQTGHEIRQLKVGKWYTNPEYVGIQYCKIKTIDVCMDVVVNPSFLRTYYNSIKFDEIIDDSGNYIKDTKTQSNNRFDEQMREVDDEFIKTLIENNN